uniref:Uncharacterized protein n=1 Tax=Chrysemys picta bellii TaxID=8478 RepID=A0A8C3HRP6_CHRPI
MQNQCWSSNGEGDPGVVSDYPTMSRILQEFGVFQSPLELKALVQEITGNTRSTVPYKDFTMVMLGRRSTMCQRYAGEPAEKANQMYCGRVHPAQTFPNKELPSNSAL